MLAYIKAISYYLPKQQITNQDLANLFPEWKPEKIANKIGVQTRHISATNEFASDLAFEAAQKLFQEHGIDRGSIDFLLYCTQSPDYFLPTTACILQERLRIPTSAGALDYNQGCSGYIYGLALAKGLIISGVAKNILLITAETYSKFIHTDDKSNRTIFGDGAAATLISTSGFALINEFELGTNGKGFENLIVKNGAVKNPINATSGSDRSSYLYMNGPEIFNFTIETVPLLITSVLKKNNIKKEDISLFVLHQANSFMLEHLRKKTNIETNKFYNNIIETGNTVSSTIPIALHNLRGQTTAPSGSRYLLAGFGVGYSWGGTVISFE